MEKKEDFLIPEDMAEWINLKKSEYLSKLIEKASPKDFGFEEFHLFDKFIPGTIENPDKTIEYSEDNQKLRTYIRTYKDKELFHQIIQGVLINDKNSDARVYVPILCFVTRNDEVVRFFSAGEVVHRPTLN